MGKMRRDDKCNGANTNVTPRLAGKRVRAEERRSISVRSSETESAG